MTEARRAVSEAATLLGRKGARKGGIARAAALTAEERSEIARQGGLAKAKRKRKRRVRRKK